MKTLKEKFEELLLLINNGNAPNSISEPAVAKEELETILTKIKVKEDIIGRELNEDEINYILTNKELALIDEKKRLVMRMNSKHFSYRLQKFVFGSWLGGIQNFCPYFWVTILAFFITVFFFWAIGFFRILEYMAFLLDEYILAYQDEQTFKKMDGSDIVFFNTIERNKKTITFKKSKKTYLLNNYVKRMGINPSLFNKKDLFYLIDLYGTSYFEGKLNYHFSNDEDKEKIIELCKRFHNIKKKSLAIKEEKENLIHKKRKISSERQKRNHEKIKKLKNTLNKNAKKFGNVLSYLIKPIKLIFKYIGLIIPKKETILQMKNLVKIAKILTAIILTLLGLVAIFYIIKLAFIVLPVIPWIKILIIIGYIILVLTLLLISYLIGVLLKRVYFKTPKIKIPNRWLLAFKNLFVNIWLFITFIFEKLSFLRFLWMPFPFIGRIFLFFWYLIKTIFIGSWEILRSIATSLWNIIVFMSAYFKSNKNDYCPPIIWDEDDIFK